MAEWDVAMRSWVSQTSRFPPASVSEEELSQWPRCERAARNLWSSVESGFSDLCFTDKVNGYTLSVFQSIVLNVLSLYLVCLLLPWLCLKPTDEKDIYSDGTKNTHRTWADSLIPKDGWLWMNSLLNDAMLKVRTCPLYKMFYDFEWCEFARSCWHNYEWTNFKINTKMNWQSRAFIFWTD